MSNDKDFRAFISEKLFIILNSLPGNFCLVIYIDM